MKLKYLLAIGFAMATVISSCEDDVPEPPNEEEVITTLRYILTPVSGGADVILTFTDLDGDGGNPPVITGGTLDDSTDYNGSLELFNESVTPVVDIGSEVDAEAEDHQFFFSASANLDAEVIYDDKDMNSNPVGLITVLKARNAGSGTLTIVLRHEPDKSATGVMDGDITNAGGETDIEVSFDLVIQ